MSQAAGPRAQTASTPLTNLDWWKAAALLLTSFGTYGFFLGDDETIWPAIGRAGVPIFFFLIGFARSRSVPWIWWALGILITALDYWTAEDIEDVLASIMISFALIRLARPLVEAYVAPNVLTVLAFAIALIVADPWLSDVVEYGSHGWLLALAGLVHRRWLDSDATWPPPERILLALLGLAAFLNKEVSDHDVEGLHLALMITLNVLTIGGLVFLRMGDSRLQAPAPIAALVRLVGNRTLEIYALTVLAGFMFVRLLGWIEA